MYARYGSYVHPPNLLRVRQSAQYLYTDRGEKLMLEALIALEGALPIENEADGIGQLVALQNAYKQNGKDFVWHTAGGRETPVRINSGTTFMGTQVLRPPTVSNPDPTQWSTYIYYSLEVKGSIDLIRVGEQYGNPVLSYTETVEPVGDCSSPFVYVPQDQTRWQEQRPRKFSLMRVRQYGAMTTLNSYAQAPAPLWPSSPPFLRDSSTPPNWPIQVSPKVLGRRFHTYQIRWTYNFLSNTPLTPRFPHFR